MASRLERMQVQSYGMETVFGGGEQSGHDEGVERGGHERRHEGPWIVKEAG